MTTTMTTTTFEGLEILGWKRLGDGHGRFPTLRLGRVTLDTETRTVFLRGEGGFVVSQPFRQFTTEEAAVAAALTLADLLA